MSQRDRAQRRRSPRDEKYVARDRTWDPAVPRDESSWADGARAVIEAPTRPGVAGIALVPLRIFLGVTFLYAGLDKLIDPAFLSGSGPGSVGAQMAAFAHTSPLGPLVIALGQPFPIAVGAGIALLEIAVGVGALTGLLFRACATAGAALAILFWLTASWAIKPYYYGPDLPYALGWITLALAGTGGMFTIHAWLPWTNPTVTPHEQRRRRLAAARGRPMPEAVDGVTRRAVLEAGLIGGVALVLASFGAVLGPVVRGRDGAALGSSPGASRGPTDLSTTPASPADAGTTGASPMPESPGPAQAASSAGTPIGNMARLRADHPIGFTVPGTGDPGAVLLLPGGKVVAYDLTCTHAGCPVGYDASSRLLICPCHGATFDPAHGARVLGGPTDQPLAALPIQIDRTTGQISLIS
jgi:thiosulfate dehydrogenase [quinone] large subunit